MFKKFVIPLLSLGLILAGTQTAWAETVLEKVARTGVLSVGADLDTIPYSYVNDKGEPDGYTISLINLIKAQLSNELGKDVTLEIVEAGDIKSRVTKLLTSEIDIACDTGFTWNRDKYIGFSTSYSISGVRLLIAKDSALGSPESLAGKRIAVVPTTIYEKAIKLIQPKAELVPFKSLEEAVGAFKQNLTLKDGSKLDAVAGDGLLMDGLRQKEALTETQLVPDKPYAQYGIACMVRQNDPSFLRLVNYTIVKMMEGYLEGDKDSTAMINRWLGPEGIVNIDPQEIRSFFNYTVITHEQIPPKSNP